MSQESYERLDVPLGRALGGFSLYDFKYCGGKKFLFSRLENIDSSASFQNIIIRFQKVFDFVEIPFWIH